MAPDTPRPPRPTGFVQLEGDALKDMREYIAALQRSQTPRPRIAERRDPRQSYGRRDPRAGRDG